jgi:DNA-binding protein YbaB
MSGVATGAAGTAASGMDTAAMMGQMQQMSAQTNASTMATAQMQSQQALVGGLSSLETSGAKQIADAAKGQ